jgi:hypothetical protein
VSQEEAPRKLPTRATRSRDGVWRLAAWCDRCGREHFHGGGDGREPEYGHRTAHCNPVGGGEFLRGYELVPAEDDGT